MSLQIRRLVANMGIDVMLMNGVLHGMAAMDDHADGGVLPGMMDAAMPARPVKVYSRRGLAL